MPNLVKFSSMRMKHAWLANIRQDIVLGISEIAPVARAMHERAMTHIAGA